MKPDRLSPIQLMTLTAAAILSVDVLMVQRVIINIAQQDAWISLVLGGLLTLVMGTFSFLLATMYPDMDYPEIHIEAAGKLIGRILLLGLLVYMLLYIGLSLRIFAMALKMFLMDRTPIYALVIFMVLTTSYAVYKGIYTIGTIVDIIFPFSIVTVAAIILLSIPQADFKFLMPVLFENRSGLLQSIIPSYQQFAGYGLILYFYKCSEKSKSSYLWYFAGILIPIVAYVALTVVSIGVFGPKDIATLIYPTLTLLKAIEFPASFLERLESFAAVLWIGIVFISAILFYYASTRNMMVLFSIKDKYHSFVVWGQIPIIIFIALFTESGLMVLEHFVKLGYLQTFLGITLFGLLIITAIKKKRRKGNET